MKAITRVKLRLFLKGLPQYAVVLTILFITAWMTNKYAEAASFALSFCVLRHKFTNILHCKTVFKCMLLTNGIIVICIPFVMPLTTSLFGGVVAAFAVNYVADLVASGYFRQQEKAELEELRKLKFTQYVYSLSEPELRKYCRAHGLDDIDEEIVVQRLIYHTKGQELYDKIGYSKSQMIRKEKHIENRLNIKLKDR